MNIVIRREELADQRGIWDVNAQAFGQEAEANLVDALRKNGKVILSLVAEIEGRVVGHILFSQVAINDKTGAGLAPMAVLPEFQKKGIGSLLIAKGISGCRDLKYDFIAVLGHPNYYPRFGFKPSVQYGIKSEYDVPDDTFMILELRKDSLKGVHGVLKYQPEFNDV